MTVFVAIEFIIIDELAGTRLGIIPGVRNRIIPGVIAGVIPDAIPDVVERIMGGITKGRP